MRGRTDGHATTETFEELLGELSSSFIRISTAELDDRLTQALRKIALGLGFDRSTLAQFRPPDFQHLWITHSWAKGDTPVMEAQKLEATFPDLAGRVLRGESLGFSDPQEIPAGDERRRISEAGLRSNLILPLDVGGEIVGALGVGTCERCVAWDDPMVRRLRLLAEILGSTLARRRYRVVLEEQLAFEALAAELSTRFVRMAPETVRGEIEAALERIAARWEFQQVSLLEIEEGKGIQASHVYWDRAATRGGAPWVSTAAAREGQAEPEAEAEERSVHWPWAGTELLAGRSISFASLRDLPDEAEAVRSYLQQRGIQAGIILPILVGERLRYAVTYFATADRAAGWSEETYAHLKLLAETLAAALERFRADQEIRTLVSRLEVENLYLREEIRSQSNFRDIVGESAALRASLYKVEQVAPTDAPVLILGETGTGKELFARAVHDLSRRKSRSLVKVNCAALPSTLIESELFGHVRGAFTGATTAKVGRFELADGGSIFLDEIGDMEMELQAKLLRVLQEGEFEPVGSSVARTVDVRVIAATNRDLRQAIDAGTFRSDLYYRLNVFPVELPPLRDRSGDLPLLVRTFVERGNRRLGRSVEVVPGAVLTRLQSYSWPGNVRELQNVIDRALILSPGKELNLDIDLGEAHPTPEAVKEEAATPSTPRLWRLDEVEREHLLKVLELCAWKINGRGNAADRLGLHPSTLRHRLEKLGIRRPT